MLNHWNSNNAFCLTDTLTSVQNATGQDVSISNVASLLAGNSAGLGSLTSALGGGRLCTGCVGG